MLNIPEGKNSWLVKEQVEIGKDTSVNGDNRHQLTTERSNCSCVHM